MDIRTIIEKKIQQAGLTKKEVAERMGIIPNNIHAMITSPSWPTLERLAAALGVSIATLVTDDDAAEQQESLVKEQPTDIPAGVMICPKCGARLTVASCEECGGE